MTGAVAKRGQSAVSAGQKRPVSCQWRPIEARQMARAFLAGFQSGFWRPRKAFGELLKPEALCTSFERFGRLLADFRAFWRPPLGWLRFHEPSSALEKPQEGFHQACRFHEPSSVLEKPQEGFHQACRFHEPPHGFRKAPRGRFFKKGQNKRLVNDKEPFRARAT